MFLVFSSVASFDLSGVQCAQASVVPPTPHRAAFKKCRRNKELARFGVFREVQGVKNADICARGIDTAPRRVTGDG
jgi:hypothetical protein